MPSAIGAKDFTLIVSYMRYIFLVVMTANPKLEQTEREPGEARDMADLMLSMLYNQEMHGVKFKGVSPRRTCVARSQVRLRTCAASWPFPTSSRRSCAPRSGWRSK